MTIKFEYEAHNDQVWRGVFSHNDIKDLFQLDFPNPFTLTERFTVFWRGIIQHSDLCHFMSDVFEPSNDLLATLFFFQHAQLRLPPRMVPKIPSVLEEAILAQYGARPDQIPLFARYELYPRSTVPADDLRLSRIVGWAELPMPRQLEDSEIGVFTSLTTMCTPVIQKHVANLLHSTVSNLGLEEAQEGIGKMIKFIEERIP